MRPGWRGLGLVVGALATAGCGRFGYDPLAEGDAGAVDPDAAREADAGPCVTGCLPVDSRTGYSPTVNGHDGWFYGVYHVTADLDGVYDPLADVEPLAFDEVHDRWVPEGNPTAVDAPGWSWVYIVSSGAHPNVDEPTGEASWAIRRWRSSETARAVARIAFAKGDLGGGDGTTGRLFVDGVERWSAHVEAADSIGVTEDVAVDLVPGTLVDLTLEGGATDGQDHSAQHVIIEAAP